MSIAIRARDEYLSLFSILACLPSKGSTPVSESMLPPCLQGFGNPEQTLPESVAAAGNAAAAALAALTMHLKRIKAFDELAKSSAILPYDVRTCLSTSMLSHLPI